MTDVGVVLATVVVVIVVEDEGDNDDDDGDLPSLPLIESGSGRSMSGCVRSICPEIAKSCSLDARV